MIAPTGRPDRRTTPRPGTPTRQDPADSRTERPRGAELTGVTVATCVRPDDLIQVDGRGLHANGNYTLKLILPAGDLILEVVAWQGSRLIARLKNDPRLVGGQRYRLSLTGPRGRPAGPPRNISIELCRATTQTAETPPNAQLAQAAVQGELTVLLNAGGPDVAPTIAQLGYAIVERVQLAALGQEILRLSGPPSLVLPDAVAQLRTALPAAIVDANSIYELQAKPRLYARKAIGWPVSIPACVMNSKSVRIGLIDGRIDLDHPALSGQQIVTRSFLRDTEVPTSADHATGIAAILVGNSKNELGLLPGAQLFAAGIFRRNAAGKDMTSTLVVAAALDWIVGQSVRVINLSFAGPRNSVLSAILRRASRRGISLVAAAGNFGPSAAPAYPAADEQTIAVTALDAAGRIYKSANHGSYIEFAAPGVDIWTAKTGDGGAYRSGTSFAAPYVTAAVAAMLARNPRLPTGLLRESLRRGARDLGPPGRDPAFGWGLLQRPAGCP